MADVIQSSNHVLDFAFNPRSIAIVGASDQPLSFGYHYLKHLLDYGYKGNIYPVNPAKATILNVKTYPSLGAVPEDVDFVICCVPTNKVLPLLDECPLKNVKIMHMLTARLGETGRPQARELERQIQARAKELGIHLVGPNCMGIYNSRSGVSFGYNFPIEPGDIGIVFQSGGAATMLIWFGGLQGLRFSKAISYGNALDIDESDILDYMAEDKDTKFIAAYFEGVKNGKKFLNSLKNAASKKPVVAIKGGRGISGVRAVSSHTAAIAGAHNLWQTAFNQSGVIEVNGFEEMVNQLTLFKYLRPIKGKRVGIIGGGGGKCVVAADLAEEAGLMVPPLSAEIRQKLKAIVPDLWDWLGNPIDYSIWGGSVIYDFEIPRLFVESPDFDFVIVEVSEDNPNTDDMWVNVVKLEVENIINILKNSQKPIIAILSGAKPGFDDLENIRWRTLAEQRSKLVQAKIPVFDTIAEAVSALSKYIDYWQKKN
jgi:acyl-CoA synthetase (NDP forming)